MIDLYDFFGTFSLGIKITDLHPEKYEIDKYLVDTIKKEAENGDQEAIEFLNRRD